MPSTNHTSNNKGGGADLQSVYDCLARLEQKVDFVSHQLVSLNQTFDVDKCLCTNCSAYTQSITSELAALQNGFGSEQQSLSARNNGAEGARLAKREPSTNHVTSSSQSALSRSSALKKLDPADTSENASMAADIGGHLSRLFSSNAALMASALSPNIALQQLFAQQLKPNNAVAAPSPPQKNKKRKATVPVKVESDITVPPIAPPENGGYYDSSPASSASSTPSKQLRVGASPPLAKGEESPPPSGYAGGAELKGCPICGKLLHRGYLPNHIKAKHQNRTPALCYFCGKEFSFVSNLYRHLRKIHNATHQDNNALNPSFASAAADSDSPAAQLMAALIAGQTASAEEGEEGGADDEALMMLEEDEEFDEDEEEATEVQAAYLANVISTRMPSATVHHFATPVGENQ